MNKFLYPTDSFSCIFSRPSECRKSVFLTNIISNNIFEFEKIHIYSPSLHQDLYQKSIKCFGNYLPSNLIPNIPNEKDIHLVIDEIVNDKDFEKSDT